MENKLVSERAQLAPPQEAAARFSSTFISAIQRYGARERGSELRVIGSRYGKYQTMVNYFEHGGRFFKVYETQGDGLTVALAEKAATFGPNLKWSTLINAPDENHIPAFLQRIKRP